MLPEDKDQIARSLTEKLIAHSTGAVPTAADKPEVEAIVSRTSGHGYGFKSLVHEVVQSQLFQSK
jgi:hypothetical protein